MSSSTVCWVKNDERRRRPSRADKPVYLFLFHFFFAGFLSKMQTGTFVDPSRELFFYGPMKASAVEGILAPLTPPNRFLELIPSSLTPADYRPMMVSKCFRPPGQVASAHGFQHTKWRTHTHAQTWLTDGGQTKNRYPRMEPAARFNSYKQVSTFFFPSIQT